MVLTWCQELNTTVAMLMPVPANKLQAPGARIFQGSKPFDWIFRPVFAGLEDGFGIWIIIADSWPAARRRHPQLVQGR